MEQFSKKHGVSFPYLTWLYLWWTSFSIVLKLILQLLLLHLKSGLLRLLPHLAEDNVSGCENLKLQIRRRVSYLRRTSTGFKENSEFISKQAKFTPKKYRQVE